MNRLRQDLAIISRTGYALAILTYFAFLFLFGHIAANDPKMPEAVRIILTVFVPVPIALLVLLVAYVNADARRRGMRYVLWTFLALFIPNALGIILYFLLRDPLPVYCPNCSASVKPGFPYCPYCGAGLSRACPDCKREVQEEWTHCPNCGSSLPVNAPGIANR